MSDADTERKSYDMKKYMKELWGYENCDKLASYFEKLEKHKK